MGECEWINGAMTRKEALPQLISSSYGLAGEQGDPWEAQVLVFGEHSHRKQIGLAQVVHKPTDIAIELGIDAVDLANLNTHKFKASITSGLEQR